MNPASGKRLTIGLTVAATLAQPHGAVIFPEETERGVMGGYSILEGAEVKYCTRVHLEHAMP